MIGSETEQFGRLVHEEERIRYEWFYKSIAILLLVIAISFDVYAFLRLQFGPAMSYGERKEFMLVVYIGLLLTAFGILILALTFRASNLKIYEHGVTLPVRSLAKTLTGQEEFIPFRLMEEIIWDDKLQVVTIRTRKRNYRIFIPYIRDKRLFMMYVEGRTRMVRK